MERRRKGFKFVMIGAGLLILVMIMVSIFHDGDHRYSERRQAAFDQHGQVYVVEKGHGFGMSEGRFSRGEGREHHVSKEGAFLSKLLWILLIVGLISFWLYRRVKRYSPRIESTSAIHELHLTHTPTRNVDLLDEWEKNINKEEK